MTFGAFIAHDKRQNKPSFVYFYIHLLRILNMIRFKLKELIAQKEFQTGQRIMVKDIADATGLNRTTISKLMNTRGASTSTDNIDKLCDFFDCEVSDVIERVILEQ
jgi:putative transcriptional regulator